MELSQHRVEQNHDRQHEQVRILACMHEWSEDN